MKDLLKINEDVFVYQFNDENDQPNIGYIKGEKNALLVDVGGSKRILDDVICSIKNERLIIPNIAIITHHHWDHSFAGYFFEGKLYGSERINYKFDKMREINASSFDDLIDDDMIPLFCKMDIMKEYKNVNEIKLRNMDILVNEETSIDLGNKIIKIIPIICSHTKGTLLVYSKKDEVLFTGDAEYGYIVGMNFIDDFEKLKIFRDKVDSIDCKYIVNGHSRVYLKEEYMQMLDFELYNLK